MKIVIITGPAGAGKSVQAERQKTNEGFVWLSTGALLRERADERLRAMMAKGVLVPDEDIYRLLEDEFQRLDRSATVLLDGIPRTVDQSTWLLSLADRRGYRVQAIINLMIDADTVIKRMVERGRHDDTESAIRQRLAEYRNKVVPAIDVLKAAGVPVLDINARGTIDEVAEEIKTKLNVYTNQNAG